MPDIQDFEWPYNGSNAGEQAYDESENLVRKIEELDDQLHQERERRKAAERENEFFTFANSADVKQLDAFKSYMRGWLKKEQERAEQYAGILRKIVEAQDEIDVEAEKPLHQRSTAPMVKKIEAIKEARRVLGGE